MKYPSRNLAEGKGKNASYGSKKVMENKITFMELSLI